MFGQPRWLTWAVLIALTALLGCGDDGPMPLPDSGTVDSAVDGGTDAVVVTPPEIPWLDEGVPPIMLAPCPEGWREVTGHDVTECDPYPEGGAATCGMGEAHFPGEPGCRAVGDACPAGDYAAALPSDGPLVYVKAGAAAGGDGSSVSPYAELGDVPWAELAPGTTVALAKGTYDGRLVLTVGIHVVGACAAETVLTGIDPSAERDAVVFVGGGGGPSSVRNLTIADAPAHGAETRDGGSLTLSGVVLDGSHEVGLFATSVDTHVILESVVIRNTQSPPTDGFRGRGIHVADGARLDAADLILDGNRDVGLLAIAAPTAVSLEDVVVRDTQPPVSNGPGGLGVYVGAGARFDASRLVLSGNHQVGVYAREEGTSLTLVDTIVRDTRSQMGLRNGGRGFNVQGGAHLDATRLLVAGNREFGIFVENRLTTMTLADAVIRDTEVQESTGNFGRGVGVQNRARFEASRLLVTGNHESGIFISDEGTAVVLSDTAVRNTLPNVSTEHGGRAVEVYYGSDLEASRLLLSNNHDLGLFVATVDTEARIADVVIRDVMPRASDGSLGRGLQLQDYAHLRASRMRIEEIFEAAVVSSDGAVAELEDLSVAHVHESACTTGDCRITGFGHGLTVISATLSLRRFELLDSELCGVFLSPEATVATPLPTSVDLEVGLVAQSAIGACVQVDGYDFGRLTNDVAYLDNVLSLESTMLAVPESVEVP